MTSKSPFQAESHCTSFPLMKPLRGKGKRLYSGVGEREYYVPNTGILLRGTGAEAAAVLPSCSGILT